MMVWYARSSMSENPRVRRRLQVVEGLMSVGTAAFYALRAENRNSTLALMVVGLVVALWVFRGLRFLLRRGSQEHK